MTGTARVTLITGASSGIGRAYAQVIRPGRVIVGRDVPSILAISACEKPA